jgi:hypothetical protein
VRALRRSVCPIVQPSESAGAAAAEGDAVLANPMGAVLARHVLRDGEIVILTLKPSVLFIPFSCLKFCAAVLILMIASQLFNESLPHHGRTYLEVGIFVLAVRLVWAFMQWTSKLYILTDLRVITITGVFTTDIFACPLRKVARTRLVYTLKERVLGLGSIEIVPSDEQYPFSLWQTVARARQVQRQVNAAVTRAKQGGAGVR